MQTFYFEIRDLKYSEVLTKSYYRERSILRDKAFILDNTDKVAEFKVDGLHLYDCVFFSCLFNNPRGTRYNLALMQSDVPRSTLRACLVNNIRITLIS